MGRNTRRVLIAALVIFSAGVAGAQSTPTATTSTTTGATSTGTTSPSTLAAAATSPVEQIVSLARTVPPGTPTVTAFTVPADRQLIVTDVLITNPGTTPVCGAAISPSGAATSAATGGATTTTALGATTPANATADTGTITSTAPTTTTTPGGSTVSTTTTTTATVESGTGTLCIPAQTSLSLSLTTGLEFAGGQSVVLANQPIATTPTTTTGAVTNGPLLYHLRGFIVAPGV